MTPTARTSSRTRTICFTLVAFALGFVTTVAVAWSFAFDNLTDNGDRAVRRVKGDGPLPRVKSPALDERSAGCLFTTRYAQPGVARWESWAVSPDWGAYLGEPAPGLLRAAESETPESLSPFWSHTELLPWVNGRDTWPGEDGLRTEDRRTVQAVGWPMLALCCSMRTSGYADQVDGAWDLSPRTRLVGGGMFSWPEPVRLPYRPVWLGLFVNTLTFAAAWSLVLFGPGALRRRIRRRAGRCVKCGYDLRGLTAGAPCPECGTTPAPSAPSSPASGARPLP